MAASPSRYTLPESALPTHWYNITPDLPVAPPPPLHATTHAPLPPSALSALFAPALVAQEASADRFVPIPPPVRAIYARWRPTPLFRAHRLEAALNTPARIFYKYEGGSPSGSHKANSAVAQAYYNSLAGTSRLVTETGAGQWGSALAFACHQFHLPCSVYQVRASYDAKPHRRTLMRLWGADIRPSPSPATDAGQAVLAKDPRSPGSLGIAVSEAIEHAVATPGAKYALGSVLNHVLLHQTVIGEEALLQLDLADVAPDLVLGCTGGGSNLAGLSFPLLRERWKRNAGHDPVVRCVEPAACPTLTRGQYRYDFGDSAGHTPLFKMHTLGHEFVPDPIHAGGLRFHGMAPLVSHLVHHGEMEAEAIAQNECFRAGRLFARCEGIVPAPEPTHAIAGALREAARAKETGEQTNILLSVCGHGLLDLAAYEKLIDGTLEDHEYPTQKVAQAMAKVPVVRAANGRVNGKADGQEQNGREE